VKCLYQLNILHNIAIHLTVILSVTTVSNSNMAQV